VSTAGNDDKSPLIDLLSCIACNQTMRLDLWTPGEDVKLRALALAGLSLAEILQRIGRPPRPSASGDKNMRKINTRQIEDFSSSWRAAHSARLF
jgi:hypothetical protein